MPIWTKLYTGVQRNFFPSAFKITKKLKKILKVIKIKKGGFRQKPFWVLKIKETLKKIKEKKNFLGTFYDQKS